MGTSDGTERVEEEAGLRWRIDTSRSEVTDNTSPRRTANTLITLSENGEETGVPRANVDARVNSVKTFLDRVPSLLAWVQREGREFPWRPTDDAWNVYAIEILLQRTRAGAVADMYDAFFEKYPTPQSLLEADRDEIVDAVSSLGFGERRTDTLLTAARFVVEDHGGTVPGTATELRQPKGIGPYTARATAVFGQDGTHGLVDTNTARIFGRVFDVEIPRKADEDALAHTLVDSLTPMVPEVARAFNLALLDLGAMVCTPSEPDCDNCPLKTSCAYACGNGTGADAPSTGKTETEDL